VAAFVILFAFSSYALQLLFTLIERL